MNKAKPFLDPGGLMRFKDWHSSRSDPISRAMKWKAVADEQYVRVTGHIEAYRLTANYLGGTFLHLAPSWRTE